MADLISQKIVLNLNTTFSLGRLSAQSAHASWISVLDQGYWDSNDNFVIPCKTKPELKSWLSGQFTKVMLRGWGDDMLLSLRDKAEENGIPFGLMSEDGFHTALSIGPALTKDIDLTIGKLLLL